LGGVIVRVPDNLGVANVLIAVTAVTDQLMDFIVYIFSITRTKSSRSSFQVEIFSEGFS
jgi:hypothetical protein